MRVALVERAKAGDQLAFAQLVDLDADRCYAIAYRILRDPDRAHDAVQQAFLLAWRDLPQLRDPDRFESWLRRLLVNACYEESRRHRRWSQHVREIPTEVPAADDDTLTVDERDAIERAFERLSPEHRAVVVLHHYAGVPLDGIAAMLGIPLGTVKSRLHHAVRILRDELGSGRLDQTKARPA